MKKNRDSKEVGNGKAVFLSEMTVHEYDDYVEDVEHGWGKFKRKIFNLKN